MPKPENFDDIADFLSNTDFKFVKRFAKIHFSSQQYRYGQEAISAIHVVGHTSPDQSTDAKISAVAEFIQHYQPSGSWKAENTDEIITHLKGKFGENSGEYQRAIQNLAFIALCCAMTNPLHAGNDYVSLLLNSDPAKYLLAEAFRLSSFHRNENVNGFMKNMGIHPMFNAHYQQGEELRDVNILMEHAAQLIADPLSPFSVRVTPSTSTTSSSATRAPKKPIGSKIMATIEGFQASSAEPSTVAQLPGESSTSTTSSSAPSRAPKKLGAQVRAAMLAAGYQAPPVYSPIQGDAEKPAVPSEDPYVVELRNKVSAWVVAGERSGSPPERLFAQVQGLLLVASKEKDTHLFIKEISGVIDTAKLIHNAKVALMVRDIEPLLDRAKASENEDQPGPGQRSH